MLAFKCRHCRSNHARRSRKRSVFERVLLPLFLLRPVRCEHCYRRQYVTVLCQLGARSQHAEPQQGMAA
jgi:hypothetical protein